MAWIDLGSKLVDIGCIQFKKQKENSDFVWYTFDTQIIIKDIFVYDEKKRKVYQKETKSGLFCFRKTGLLENESFQIIEKETDQFFLSNISVMNGILYAIYSVMTNCYKQNKYPEEISFMR